MNSWTVEKEMNAVRIDKFISERMDGVSVPTFRNLLKTNVSPSI